MWVVGPKTITEPQVCVPPFCACSLCSNLVTGLHSRRLILRSDGVQSLAQVGRSEGRKVGRSEGPARKLRSPGLPWSQGIDAGLQHWILHSVPFPQKHV